MKNKNFKSHLEKARNYHRNYENKQGIKCFNCGRNRHNKENCPGKYSTCNFGKKKGHW